MSAATTGLDREIAQLQSRLAGIVVSPNEFAYESLRRCRGGGFNPRTDKRPLLIAECATPTDVVACLEFASRHDLPLSVRGGGHNFAGLSANEGGLLLDVRRMRRVEIDV